MFYKKIQSEEGNYKDKNNVRFTVLEAHEAWTPEGLNVGWDEYPNLDEALKSYGLVYDPLPENIKLDNSVVFD